MTPEPIHISDLLDSVLAMFSQAQVPALVSDNNCISLAINKPFLRLTGYKKNELLDSSFKVIVTIKDELEIKRQRRYLEASGGHYIGYVILKGANGKEHFCRMIIDKISVAGCVYYLNQFLALNKRKIHDYNDLVIIRNVIENYLSTIKRISDLCRLANLKYPRVHFLIREFESTTPKQYLNDSRIWRCKEMLESGCKTFKEIAYELGFYDVAHLCNSFKVKTEMTLSEYVEKNC